MTLIKDLIDIPERVQKGDFVLRLAEGVLRPEDTLRDYVVTPELRLCFDSALGFIQSALENRTSKASYLHGSFGSGKSHFMAVLHLILQGNPAARGIPELAPTVTKHGVWIQGKKFLLVPYHLIGAPDMESGILGGYVEHLRRVHPDAPIAPVFLAEGLFEDARALRTRMGDGAFFGALNEGAGGGGWGDLEAAWDADRFETALEEPPGSELRSQLVSVLVGRFFKSYDLQAAGRREAFVPLDLGLSVLSKHAASLGYHGLILFLDELILWLASHAVDLKFVHQEGQKLAKLVEAQSADRPIPIVSFVARQRDLSQLIGSAVAGSERLNFADALQHWEGRFHKITLEDRNLPAIVERRILRTRSESARRELDAGFDQTVKIRESILNTLLTPEGDRQMFRRVYPFSPALVQTLIAVSSVLQRERTALKVMMQLLVDQRDTLQVGDIVPVGDLFDVIAHGDEAFSQDMAIHFENAKRLYHQKLLPLLDRNHGLRREDMERLALQDPKRVAFRADDRLIKTLLLAALVPGVESLRALTADRLVALNHGTIKTPIEGKEPSEALRRCRQWGAAVGEIRIGAGDNPTITVQLTGVDIDPILEKARREDNPGNRMRRVRQMLFEQMGILDSDEFFRQHPFTWRQTARCCEVLFANIRELPDPSLAGASETWKLVIDFPFDEPPHGPRDDVLRIQQFRDAHPDGTRTLLWVPNFFSAEALKDLGTLVILEHILASDDRVAQYTTHLSPQDRLAARSLLENQCSVLRERVRGHLEAAYGLEATLAGSLDTAVELEPHEQFQTLIAGLTLQAPVAPNLARALEHLLDQTLSHEFPAHPRFEAEARTTNLRKAQELVIAAARTEDGRVPVDRALRPLLRQIANPLMLGEMGTDATHFVLGQHWKSHFTRKIAEAGGGAPTVAQLRRWTDEPKPMGLLREVANLVILVFAEQTNRTPLLHGAPYEGKLNDLPDAVELREVALPPDPLWRAAIQRAGTIFGLAPSPLRNAANVAKLQQEIRTKAEVSRSACTSLSMRLRERIRKLGAAEDCDRLKTALATAALMERMGAADPKKAIETLAQAEIATSEAAMGCCAERSAVLVATLEGTLWDLFDNLRGRAQAESVCASVQSALMADEHVIPLDSALKAAQAQAVRLLAQPPAPVHPPPPPPLPPPPPGWKVVEMQERSELDPGSARKLLDELEAKGRLRGNQRVKLSVQWQIEEKSS